MAIPKLTIIPAGAGSGKTYTIQKTLAQWVVDGQVRPDRIVAVTFTEAAAAEMRERIKQELSQQNRIEDALLLEQSYITTIHSFGLRVLKEFAFDCGISPSPRLLNQDEEASLMRRALTITDQADAVMDNLSGFGYGYDFSSGKGAEELFRDAILKLIATLRSIGKMTPDYTLLPHAETLVEELYGPTEDAEHLENRLHAAVVELLKQFPGDMSIDYGSSDTAFRALRQDYRALKKAQDRTALACDWKLWQQLRKLRTIAIPPEYEIVAQKVIDAADALPLHPGPLADALAHLRALLGSSQDALDIHGQKKRESSLLDYTDMLAMSYRLFAENGAVRTLFKNRIDCLIIDEFQDTNPLQFSLLWQFYAMGVPVLVVGDLKQAIMGFQNADSRLLEALQTLYPQECQPLTANWRSTPALMKWINAMGSGLFGLQYTPLRAKADYPSTISSLEIILFNKRPKKTIHQVHETALRIKELLSNESELIHDRKTGQQRPVCGGDIAVLCPTNARLELFATELRLLGIATRIAQGGWFESRIIQLLYYALSYVADPDDRHAALYLRVTELGNHSLESALKQMVNGQLPEDPVITTLQLISEEQVDRGVTTLLGNIINKLSLYERIENWPDGKQARANLMRLQQEAHIFQESEPVALSCVGFFGSGVKTFLAWLKALVALEENNGQPDAKVNDANAVELVTWHRSKGREWPIVVVASLEKSVAARLPSYDVVYHDFDNLNIILDQAKIEISPAFAAPEVNDSFSKRLLPEAYTSAYRLQYVALTRAREKLIIEWPQYLSNSKAKDKTHWALLREKAAMSLDGTTFKIGDSGFECHVTNASVERGEADYTDDANSLARKNTQRVSITQVNYQEPLTPDSLTPSQQHQENVQVPSNLQQHQYSQPLQITINLPPTERGTLLHQCFEIGFTRNISFDRVIKLIDYPLGAEQWSVIDQSIQDLKACVHDLFAPTSLACELPILFQNEHKSVVSGVIDLLVENSEGFWIVDHKSDITNNYETKFAEYLPQLMCYAEAVAKARSDKPVLGVAINWIETRSLMLNKFYS